MLYEQALLMAGSDLPPQPNARPHRSGLRVVRVARFQTLFAAVGLYSFGFLVYLAVSTSGALSLAPAMSGSNALQVFPIAVGNDAPREFGGGAVRADGSNDAESGGGRRGPNLRCLGWKQTENCDPDAPIIANRNRTCDQFVRGAISGYCLMVDEDSGEEVRVMRTTCLSVRPDVVFSCRHAGEFADLRFAVNSLASDLRLKGDEQAATVDRNATAENSNNDSVVALPLDDGDNATAVRNATSEGTDGIVMVVYPKLLVSAVASLRVLRESFHCSLPIELWYSAAEMRGANISTEALEALTCNGTSDRRLLTLRALPSSTEREQRVSGFNTKVFAIAHSQFDQVLFLDADNVPVRDPSYLFATREFREFGAVFWPDFWHPDHTIFNVRGASLLWELLNLPFVDMFEQESGQLLIDRRRASRALRMLQLLAFHEPNIISRLKLAHGDKDLFRLAWLKTQTLFYMVPHPPGTAGTVRDGKFCGMSMVQADPAGDVLFLHRNAKKLTGGRGVRRKPDERIWTHLQRFQYLGLESDARRVSAASTTAVEPTSAPPTRAPGIKIRSGKLEMGYEMMKRSYQVQIYNGAPQFDATQWCYGQMGLMTARYKTVPWEETAFPHIERELLRFAQDAASELPPEKKIPLMMAPTRLRVGGH